MGNNPVSWVDLDGRYAEWVANALSWLFGGDMVVQSGDRYGIRWFDHVPDEVSFTDQYQGLPKGPKFDGWFDWAATSTQPSNQMVADMTGKICTEMLLAPIAAEATVMAASISAATTPLIVEGVKTGIAATYVGSQYAAEGYLYAGYKFNPYRLIPRSSASIRKAVQVIPRQFCCEVVYLVQTYPVAMGLLAGFGKQGVKTALGPGAGDIKLGNSNADFFSKLTDTTLSFWKHINQ